MRKLNFIVAKYLGWFLYPLGKQGKEDQNRITIKKSLKDGK
jgi:hypothetical protein